MTDYNLYRVDDRIFFVFIIAALTFCVVHAARRTFRQPPPTEAQGDSSRRGRRDAAAHPLSEDLPLGQFGCHFHPGDLRMDDLSTPADSDPGRNPFDWFFWHRWGSALLLVGIVAHIIRESFVAQEANPMVFNRTEVKRILSIFKDFFGFSKILPPGGKYHTGQIFFHWAVAGNIFLFDPDRHGSLEALPRPSSSFPLRPGLGFHLFQPPLPRLLLRHPHRQPHRPHLFRPLHQKELGRRPNPWSPAAFPSANTWIPIAFWIDLR